MQRRFNRLTRRSIVAAVVGLAFAAAAGVGLAEITTASSPTTAALTTSTTSSTVQTSTGGENDFADDEDEAGGDDEELELEHAKTTTGVQTTSTSQQTTSTSGQTTTSSDDEDGHGQQKVDVCHMTGSGKSHTINIAEPAVAAHVAHGDTEGACATTTTTTAQTTSTTARLQKPKHLHAANPAPRVTTHATHGNSGHVSHRHANPTHVSHGHSPHASSRSSHGNGTGGGHGNGHGK